MISEYCVEEAWKSQMPKKFIHEYMTRYLRTKAIIDRFEDIELTVISEFLIFNLIFIKEELFVNNYKATVLMNILLQLLTFRNHKFNNLGDKNKQSDHEHLERLLLDHSKHQTGEKIKLFDIQTVRKVVQFAENRFCKYVSYFDMYNLYEKIN